MPKNRRRRGGVAQEGHAGKAHGAASSQRQQGQHRRGQCGRSSGSRQQPSRRPPPPAAAPPPEPSCGRQERHATAAASPPPLMRRAPHRISRGATARVECNRPLWLFYCPYGGGAWAGCGCNRVGARQSGAGCGARARTPQRLVAAAAVEGFGWRSMGVGGVGRVAGVARCTQVQSTSKQHKLSARLFLPRPTSACVKLGLRNQRRFVLARPPGDVPGRHSQVGGVAGC
jgi:hypothetical protein